MADDVEKTAKLLSRLQPGFQPYPIFEQIARLVVLPIIEVIPLRISPEGKVEVLLIERPGDDPLWPGALHTPGTVIRTSDKHGTVIENWTAFRRIIDGELHGTRVGSPHYVGSLLHASKRGTEQAQLYWVEVISAPVIGNFYDVEHLPESLIGSQHDFIYQAAEDFRSNHGNAASQ